MLLVMRVGPRLPIGNLGAPQLRELGLERLERLHSLGGARTGLSESALPLKQLLQVGVRDARQIESLLGDGDAHVAVLQLLRVALRLRARVEQAVSGRAQFAAKRVAFIHGGLERIGETPTLGHELAALDRHGVQRCLQTLELGAEEVLAICRAAGFGGGRGGRRRQCVGRASLFAIHALVGQIWESTGTLFERNQRRLQLCSQRVALASGIRQHVAIVMKHGNLCRGIERSRR